MGPFQAVQSFNRLLLGEDKKVKFDVVLEPEATY
jgi:hypothetical protein